MAGMNYQKNIVLAIHAGAGSDITPENHTPARIDAHQEGLAAALRAGYERLLRGDSALDAVESAVCLLEDNPIFNAGRGAALAYDGTAQLDAALMGGSERAAGAVAGVTTIKNPITLARAVMERSPYVLLTGTGAEEFAREQRFPEVENAYFLTPERLAQLSRIRAANSGPQNTATVPALPIPDAPPGTVGAVALDKYGNLAAATSTGGMAGKRYGRIGDSPIIGAGTWADNASCAVSATGHGEFFIRYAAASDVAARMLYSGLPVDLAAAAVIENLRRVGGEGGLIALDAHGNAALPYNTPGMYRGVITASGEIHVSIFDRINSAKSDYPLLKSTTSAARAFYALPCYADSPATSSSRAGWLLLLD